MGAKTRARRYALGVRAAVLVACLTLSLPASAHLMVAQHGTLKFGKGGVFFIVSLSVSGLHGFDDNGDGLLSAKELRTHRESIKAAVKKGYVLERHPEGPCRIEGLLLNRVHRHGHTKKPASHVIAMGRFNVGSQGHPLRLKISLFGTQPGEQSFKITITRGVEKEVAVLTRSQASHQLFAKK